MTPSRLVSASTVPGMHHDRRAAVVWNQADPVERSQMHPGLPGVRGGGPGGRTARSSGCGTLPQRAGGSALGSVRTLGAALRVAKADPARPLRNDGHEQLVPLMVLEVATEDLHAVGLTSRALGRALLPGGHSTVAETLQDMAAGHLDSSLIGDRPTPQDLVARSGPTARPARSPPPTTTWPGSRPPFPVAPATSSCRLS